MSIRQQQQQQHVRQANAPPVFVTGREQRAGGEADDVQVEGRGEDERGERPSGQVRVRDCRAFLFFFEIKKYEKFENSVEVCARKL